MNSIVLVPLVRLNMKKASLFISLPNIYRSVKEKYNSHIDFQKYLEKAFQGYERVWVNAYGITTKSDQRNDLYEYLEKLKIRTKIKHVEDLTDHRKMDWSLQIVVDMFRASETCDHIILGSSSGRFKSALSYLRDKGKTVKLFACNISTAYEDFDKEEIPEEMMYETIKKPEQLVMFSDVPSDDSGGLFTGDH